MNKKSLPKRINDAFVEIESRIQNGDTGVALNILHRIVNTERNTAIDGAVEVVKSDYIGTDDRYEQDCIGLIKAIEELKQ